jgi:DegV family protein with EDD domain
MAYKIVVDSCCDLNENMKKWSNLQVVPLTLQIGDYVVVDDENFNQEDFISRMIESKELAKSACPSPDAFAKAIEGDEDEVYIITITSKLSGCYNSAMQGVALYKDEHEGSEKKIHVFNSKATAGLETLMAEKIKELADGGAAFEEIVEKIEDYCVNGLGLYFCLESMDALKGNGRLYNLAASVIEALRVKLICRRTDEGNISVAGKDLTVKRALNKMAGFIADETAGSNLAGKKCYITEVCCIEKANEVKERILAACNYAKENIIILKASGLNSLYASNGGIIVSFEK